MAMKHLLNEFICTCTGEQKQYSRKTLVTFYGASFLLFLFLVLLNA